MANGLVVWYAALWPGAGYRNTPGHSPLNGQVLDFSKFQALQCCLFAQTACKPACRGIRPPSIAQTALSVSLRGMGNYVVILAGLPCSGTVSVS